MKLYICAVFVLYCVSHILADEEAGAKGAAAKVEAGAVAEFGDDADEEVEVDADAEVEDAADDPVQGLSNITEYAAVLDLIKALKSSRIQKMFEVVQR